MAKQIKVAKDWKKFFYRLGLLLFWICFFLISIVLDWYILFQNPIRDFGTPPVNKMMFALFVELLYLILSIETVEPGEVGALVFLGKPVKHLESGLVIRPAFLSSIRRETRNIIQLEIGTPVTDEKGNAIQVQVAGNMQLYVNDEPFRVTFSGPETALYDDILPVIIPSGGNAVPERITKETKSLLHEQITADPHMSCQYRIKDMPIFLEEVGNIENANRLILQALQNATQTRLGLYTPEQARQHLTDLDKLLLKEVEKLVGETSDDETRGDQMPAATKSINTRNVRWWGVDVLGVQLSSLGLPKRVNEALADNAAQRAKSKQVANASEAEKTRLENVGAGNARAKFLSHQADADGAAKLAEQFKTPTGIAAARLQYAVRAIEGVERVVMAPPNGVLNVLNIGDDNNPPLGGQPAPQGQNPPGSPTAGQPQAAENQPQGTPQALANPQDRGEPGRPRPNARRARRR